MSLAVGFGSEIGLEAHQSVDIAVGKHAERALAEECVRRFTQA